MITIIINTETIYNILQNQFFTHLFNYVAAHRTEREKTES